MIASTDMLGAVMTWVAIVGFCFAICVMLWIAAFAASEILKFIDKEQQR